MLQSELNFVYQTKVLYVLKNNNKFIYCLLTNHKQYFQQLAMQMVLFFREFWKGFFNINLPIPSNLEHQHIADFLTSIDYLNESKANKRTKAEILTNRFMLRITAAIKKEKLNRSLVFLK